MTVSFGFLPSQTEHVLILLKDNPGCLGPQRAVLSCRADTQLPFGSHKQLFIH